MSKYNLVGPYARQVTASKLKFWFALVHEDGSALHGRYEVHIDANDRALKARARPVTSPKGPTSHSSLFAKYAVPEDLSPYPCVGYPRFKGDKLADAAATLLAGVDVSDAARVRIVGQLPSTKIPMKEG
ncbi:hypothetical protein GA830_10510 [Mesorhizobium sp. NBSH29]|uniref:hypothetical protein n=1 Tax=Mesorhizobium sp. NBSH29 TaxID=2654249 RepID=UPI00189645C6|nr:hypothetical protein [Mesorhizobium sp. NBSH29]QPC87126.1 hypothetical protein GA830_10510 [Mesorhizobium sp. NBSH29]